MSVSVAVSRLAGDRRVRYLCAGGAAAVMYDGAFTAGWTSLHRWLPYLLVALLANLITAVPTYQIYRRLVFRVDGSWWRGLARFSVMSLGSLLVITVGLPLLVEVAHVPVLPAQAIVIVGSPLVNYQLARLWAFRGSAAPDGLRASMTKPLASTPASQWRASTASSSLSGDSSHISGTSIR